MRPVASVDRRNSMSALTTSVSTSGPVPAAWDRTRLRWRSTRRLAGIERVANAPKPVEMINPAAAPVDESIQWLIEFGAAEKIGMALRIALPPLALEAAGVEDFR